MCDLFSKQVEPILEYRLFMKIYNFALNNYYMSGITIVFIYSKTTIQYLV